MSSISSAPQNPTWTSWQASLLQSCVRGDEPRVRAFLHDAPFPSPPQTSTTNNASTSPTTISPTALATDIPSAIDEAHRANKFKQNTLRLALQKVAGRGHERLTLFLLEQGASPNNSSTSSGGEAPALYKAAEAAGKENVGVVKLLLGHGADTEGKEPRSGRTAIFPAVLKGHVGVLKALVEKRAEIGARDAGGQNVLIVLASEKAEKTAGGKGGGKGVGGVTEVVKVLLSTALDLEARDRDGRTALLWAAALGKEELAQLFLTGRTDGRTNAEIRATNYRGKTALHLAAENHRVGMVGLLLEHGAEPNVRSDGGWTALHNAADKGHEDIAALLVEWGADINATTSSGMTALHWCARNGHLRVVEFLLQQKGIKRNAKDSFDSTPMLGAAQNGHIEIVEKLSPADDGHLLSESAQGACKGFQATVVDFGMEHRPMNHTKHSVFDVLYGWDEKREKPLVTTLTRNIPAKPTFRWIHLPTNNMTWVEALMTKHFVENSARDVEGFKVLEKSFGQLHRGPTVHSHFMRPLCQRMPPTERNPPSAEVSDSNAEKQENQIPKIVTPGMEATSTIETPAKSPASDKAGPEKMSKRSTKKGEKGEKASENTKNGTPSKKVGKHNPGDVTPSKRGGHKQGDRNKTLVGKAPRTKERNGNIVLFMPYLHYETHSRRMEMSSVIKRTTCDSDQSGVGRTSDEMLIQAYLHSTHNLQIRRTLDQFYYHAISTDDRDEDQVVYRYTKKKEKEVKVFMVDQLWMWILGNDLIVTSFPQRWKQPKNDPLNVLDGIIEDMSSKTRPPLRSIYDLATLITGRCSGVFDRHRVGDEDYQFLDMFESSIGEVTNKETELFKKFNEASLSATEWLKRRHNHRSQPELPSPLTDTADPLHNPNTTFVDTLLDIGKETSLLAEAKDIRDELNMISMVLKHQSTILDEMKDNLIDSTKSNDPHRRKESEIKKRFGDLKKVVEVHLKDVDRMDRQAESIYTSLTHLLDLKQKHANAFEARFARDQAAFTGRQGQTIMVFTIVTVVFLPMSFIATFFAIPIAHFAGAGGVNREGGSAGNGVGVGEGGVNQLELGYVSKFVFGVGLAISIPLIAVAFAVDNLGGFGGDVEEEGEEEGEGGGRGCLWSW
ncbi:uncharacterized protein KY384_004762 [Bacidia gigantensis]|uniref:uncharacterized protein n=1 Tax=Bacidia gigantensis TaxID=2732470 RepID=UPI001D05B14D|nr:uncharacterized protein KY384_004762 [Bacidia gigantensis]KAG8530261.1 hypothetical protein KY384_004762 [Bacidia gigantensis]